MSGRAAAARAWISFAPSDVPSHMKTRRWAVKANDGGATLGEIRWWPAWRRYVFEPAVSTVYEEDCLRIIADFIEDRTREHKAK